MLLLKTPDLWTHLTLGLFLEPEQHPRGPNAAAPVVPALDDMRAIWQRNYAETLHQLALFPSGCEAMREQTAVTKALEEVAERGMTPEAKAHAQGALMALSERQPALDPEGPKHIMLSYQVRLISLIRPLASICRRLLIVC